jgi:hypothetical protein
VRACVRARACTHIVRLPCDGVRSVPCVRAYDAYGTIHDTCITVRPMRTDACDAYVRTCGVRTVRTCTYVRTYVRYDAHAAYVRACAACLRACVDVHARCTCLHCVDLTCVPLVHGMHAYVRIFVRTAYVHIAVILILFLALLVFLVPSLAMSLNTCAVSAK